MAPKKYGRIERGVLPSRTREEKAAKAEMSVEFSSPDLVRSFRCCGRRPSGPPADPAGKEMTAFITSASDTTMGGGEVGVGGMLHPSGGDGCLSSKADKVAALEGAIVQAKRIAPLKSPSSSLDETRRPKDSRLPLEELFMPVSQRICSPANLFPLNNFASGNVPPE